MKAEMRRFFGMLFCLMLLGLMPGMTGTAKADEYNLYIGGTQVTDGNKTNIPNDNGTKTGTASYDPDTKTLTLNNYKYSGTGDFRFHAGIRSFLDSMNIVLVGDNKITVEGEDSIGIYSYKTEIKIKGNGSLGLETDNFGFRTVETGSLEIESGTLVIQAKTGYSATTKPLTIGQNAASVTISGSESVTSAGSKVINAIKARGWTDAAGTGTPVEIPVSSTGQDLSSYKKVVFKSHGHSYTYTLSESGKAISAECTAEGHTGTNPVTLTLSAADAEYTGSPYTGAGLDKTDWAAAGLTVPDIYYEGTGQTSYSSVTTAPTNAGTYKASVSAGEKTAEAAFTISKKAITPEVNITGWTYGDTAGSPTLTEGSNPGGGTPVFTYAVKGTETYSGTVPVDADDYTVKAVIPETDNYESGTDTADFTIVKRQVSVTGITAEKVYDGTAAASPVVSNAVISNIAAGDENLVTVASAFGSYSSAGASDSITLTINPDDVTLGGEKAANYSVNSVSGTGKINKRPVTLTVKNQTVELNAAISSTKDDVEVTEGQGSLAEGDAIDSVMLTADTKAVTTEGVIAFANQEGSVVIKNSGGTDVTGNYSITPVPGKLTVTKGTPAVNGTLSIVGLGYIIYGQTLGDITIWGSMKDSHTGEAVSGTFSWKEPGTKPTVSDSLQTDYEWTFTPAADQAENYSEASGYLKVKVGPKEAKIAFTDTELIYNGQPQKPTAVVSNLESGDSCSVTVTGEQTDSNFMSGTTSYQASVRYPRPPVYPLDNINYTLLQDVEVIFTIAQRPVTITAADQTVELNGQITTYADDNSMVTVTGEGLAEGDTLESVKLTPDIGTAGAGTGVISPSEPVIKRGDIDVTKNYSVLLKDGTLKVTKGAPVVDTPAAAAGIVYGQKLADSTISGSMKYGDMAVPGSFTWMEPETMPEVADSGKTEYAYVFTPDDKDNYSQYKGMLTLTVAKADAAVETAPAALAGLVYSGSPQKLVDAGKTNDGDMQYAMSMDAAAVPDVSAFGGEIPGGTDAGTYYVWYMVSPDDNHNASPVFGPVESVIGQKTAELTDAEKPHANELTYSGQPQPLVTKPEKLPEGYDKVLYSIDGGKTWTEEIPAGTEAGEYTVKVKYAGDDNHESFNGEDIPVTIARSKASGLPENQVPHSSDPVYDGTEQPLVTPPEELPEGYTGVQYSTDGGKTWTDEVPTGTESGGYTVCVMYIADDNHVSFRGEDISVIIGSAMEMQVDFNLLRNSGARGLPPEIGDLTLNPVIHVKDGDSESVSKGLVLNLTQGMDPKISIPDVEFSRKLENFAPGKYEVTVSGLPKSYSCREEIYTADGPIPGPLKTYELRTAAEINEKSGKMVITVYLVFDNGFRPDDLIGIYALPEDEIGAYWMRPDGTKEYLIFQTYDICMAWLGSDELCRGYERCFHK